ncbi:hypothetical protein FR773_25875 (plasmid) [Leclercia adecarboxylata]|uniref:hypothetical protein n=1 Tax=Leclercia adecarboxylata TaxID=83655 RepID=UPI0012A82789|nr:hypothetical protein [Leclercia adecarboxylata]QFH68067.1 hypothetical protein FR773_25875 [Leclercia adecarboxylata]
MVTYNTMRLNVPKSWDEFEDICKSSFQLRWSNPNLARHGRSGQKQDGVDVYGEDSFGHFVGIQCKNTVFGIDNKTIEDEVIKAEKFTPGIKALYIATTAPRDVYAQAFVRQLNETRRRDGKFLISIEFWDDITADLTKDPAVLRQHYPQMFDQTEPTREERLRKRDISNLLTLLDVIDFPSTIEHLRWDAKYIHSLITYEYSNIYSVYSSPVFTLSDNALSNITEALVVAWSDLMVSFRDAPYNYLSHSDTYSFHTPGDFCRNQEEHDLYDKITDQIRDLRVRIRDFCELINSHYSEINLNETSMRAQRHY